MFKMAYTVKYEISDRSGEKPKFNIAKIVDGFIIEDWKIEEVGNTMLLTVRHPFDNDNIFELKRRLCPKRNRMGTIVKILSKERNNDD